MSDIGSISSSRHKGSAVRQPHEAPLFKVKKDAAPAAQAIVSQADLDAFNLRLHRVIQAAAQQLSVGKAYPMELVEGRVVELCPEEFDAFTIRINEDHDLNLHTDRFGNCTFRGKYLPSIGSEFKLASRFLRAAERYLKLL